MWISQDGRCNTVALPNPEDAMDQAFSSGIRRMDVSELHELQRRVESRIEQEVLSPRRHPGQEERQFEGVPAPRGLLRGQPRTAADVLELIENIAARWRLDALYAVADVLDGPDEDGKRAGSDRE